MIRSIVALTCVSALLLGGCAATVPGVDKEAVQAYLSDKPPETHNLYTRVLVEGEHNRVLNLLRSGLAAMELGHDELAARTFDEALLTIETIYGDDARAAAARGIFSAEDRKTFRGEPYERAMAFYYRGILYLMEGDYENARASFRTGVLQDTLAEQDEYRQDFALLEFLEGWSSQCNGNAGLAAEAYAAAKAHKPRVVLPEAGHKLLVLADLGHAPVKYADGEHGELLRIKRNSQHGPKSARVSLSDGAEALGNSESILWQAQSRGGREFDAILEGKARFKEDMQEAAEVAGDVAQAGAAVGMAGLMSGNEDMAQLGGGVAAVSGIMSLFASAAAEATKPQADTRQWDNLPERVAYGTFRVDGAFADEVRIEFDGEPGAGVPRYGGDASCRVAWARSHPANAPSAI